MDRLQNDTKMKNRACSEATFFNSINSDLMYKRLLLIVLYFNATSDESGANLTRYCGKLKSLWEAR